MNIVFFGTSEFALGVLHRLINSKHKVLAVVTQPDRQKGRRLKVTPTPTKILAQANNIPVYQPNDASSKDSLNYLKKLNADLFAVVAFGQILKKEVLEIPRLYAVNVHGSLLPKYRGAAPTNWAIINGDRVSGITIIKMNEKMDEGDIILKKEIPIDEEDTNITLSEKLSDQGADAFIDAIELIQSGKVVLTPQENSQATYAPKLKKENGLINWNEPAQIIHNKVRGFLPWPGAYTYFNKKILKVLKTEVMKGCTGQADNGEVVAIDKDKGIEVKTGKDNLSIQYVQLESKKPFSISALLCGYKISPGYLFKK